MIKRKKENSKTKRRLKSVKELNSVILKCMIKMSNKETHRDRKRTQRYKNSKGRMVM